MSEYYFSKKVSTSFEDTIELIKTKIPEIGFGIVSEIDVTATFKKKLNVDFRNYRILGACHPQNAYLAIQAENKIGTMLPCNIIVQEFENGEVEIAAVDPIASMQAIKNDSMSEQLYAIQQAIKGFINNF